MKKRSLFIVVAMVLLLAVVLGMGGTTFAKYITKDNFETQSATVAKWGYVVDVDATELFGEQYADSAIATAGDVDVKLHVDGDDNNDHNLVAPGTTGKFTVSVDGQAEVLSRISFAMENVQDVVLAGTDLVYGAENYYPIKWTVVDTNKTDDPGTPEDESVLTTVNNLAALEAWIEGQTTINEADADIDIDWEISWDWNFENGDNNKNDTRLGDIIAGTKSATQVSGEVKTNTTIAFDLTVTVEQIQNADRT